MKKLEKQYPIDVLCESLNVSKSGYYGWRGRDNSEREAKRLKLLRAIEDVYRAGRGNYGSPRIYDELKGLGYNVSKSTVERVMRENKIRARTKRRFRVTTDSKHTMPVAPNLLKRNFSPEKPNQVWASDITYIWTKEGWLFLCVVIDLFSRQVVGWELEKQMTKELILSALDQSIYRRQPGTGLIFHSDRGSQYCSEKFRDRLAAHQILQSQSRRANCWDNACVESFFHTLKTESIYHEAFETREEARRVIFEWVEAFYNRQRKHSTLGYKSPIDFERQALEEAA